MTYIITTNSGGDPETFRTITERVDAFAVGLIARYAGMTERGLAVTAVWESKAHSDRFAAEHLMPALRDLFAVGTEPPVMVDFDAFDEFHAQSMAPAT